MEMCASNRELSRPTHRARVTESKRERERGGGTLDRQLETLPGCTQSVYGLKYP